jgi:RNA polymerase sigma factor (sigma-70 family)
VSSTAHDHELLREYSERRSEEAFAELVRRHLDVVYSTARRIVQDPSLAEDITQQVFLALAADASKLSRHPVLCGWLHRATRNVAANLLRSETRRREREQEATRMHSDIESDTTWAKLEPELDEALGHLSDPDREVVLLRFFHGKTAREIADLFRITEEAAQKRVNRAVERLRRTLASRAVTVGAQSLAASIAAHSAAAAPAGLATSISSALGRGTMHHSALLGASDALTMTLMQKSIVAVSIAAAVGAGFWQFHQNSSRRNQMHLLEQRVASVAAQMTDARAQRDDASLRVRAAEREEQRLRELASSAPQLRQQLSQIKAAADGPQDEPTDPAVKAWLERVEALKALPASMPDKAIPELALLQDDDWIEVARKSLDWEDPDPNGQIKWHLLSSQPVSLMIRKENTLTEAEKARLRLQELRARAKIKFGSSMARALHAYVAGNDGRIPADISELRPFFATPPDDAMLARYEVRQKGLLNDQPSEQIIVAEKAFADPLYDTRLVFQGKDALRLQEMIEIENPSGEIQR